MIKKLSLVTAFCLTMLVTGCTAGTNTTKSSIHASPTGFSFSLTDPATSLTKRQDTFKVTDGTFSPKIDIGNNMETSNTYELLTFLDYHQVAFSYHGKNTSDVKITERPMQRSSFTISIAHLTPGVHNLLCVAVVDPYQYLTNSQHIPTNIQLVRRVTLLVKGNYSSPKQVFTHMSNQANTIQVPLDQPYITATSTIDPNSALIHTNTDKLFLHFKPSPETRYAIILLSDYRQVEPATFVDSSGSGVVTLPLNLRASQTASIRDIEVMIVNHPFARLEDNAGHLHMPHYNWAPTYSNITLQDGH